MADVGESKNGFQKPNGVVADQRPRRNAASDTIDMFACRLLKAQLMGNLTTNPSLKNNHYFSTLL
jgi:hypothetical protein